MKLNIKIPTALSDITLGQYKRFLAIKDKTEENRFLNAKMIEIFCNVKLEDVMLLKMSDVNEIIGILSKLFEEKPQLVKQFKLGKVNYGFHPQLDDLELGEYIELDTYIGDWDNMEKAMNVLYRPILVSLRDKYSIEKHIIGKEVVLLNMPMDAVMSSIFFLWNLGLELSQVMTNSLENQVDNKALTEFLNSQANGDGIRVFTDSLSEILQDLKISLN